MSALLALVCVLVTAQARASTGELYGYGSRASALGNTMLGGVSDPFATFYNPAANSAHPGLQASLGTDYAHPHFLGIQNVTVLNSATSSKTADVKGDVDTSNYEDHLGQMVALSLNVGETFKNLTLGVMAFLPLTHIAYLDSGDPFLPEYVSYRSRTQRPQIYGALSAQPISHLFLAMGIAISTNLSAKTNAYLTINNNSFSHQQFASTIKPGAAPYFSAYVDPGPLQLGGTIRMPNRYSISLDVNADAGVLGGLSSLPLALNSSSTLYYDPLEIDGAIAYKFTPQLWLTAEADWLQYKAFEAPTFTVVQQPSGIALNNSISTAPPMKNILVPKVGIQYSAASCTLRGGYMFRPSPISDNSGPGNLVDPARHTFTAGLGFDLKKLNLTEKDVFLDLHAQYHLLVKTHIDKRTGGNEAGVAGQTLIGSPGYDIGGSIYGGGFSLTMAL